MKTSLIVASAEARAGFERRSNAARLDVGTSGGDSRVVKIDASTPAHRESPPERQLDAYNARDLDAFIACYAEDVVVDDALGARILEGHAALAARYGPMFERYPNLRCEVTLRIQIGDFVLHEERIMGRNPDAEHVVAIYLVTGDVIRHVRFLR